MGTRGAPGYAATMSASSANLALIEQFWRDLYERRDYDQVGKYFTDDGLYRDVPAPDAGAVGPEAVTKRLRIGLEPVERFEHAVHNMICQGDVVITEHTETWHWHTGESVALPFCSVHEIEGGKIKVWRDYWNLDTLLSGAPQWWVEHIMTFTQADFDAP
jgi:limonene-1,2-epoxide hydrolase